MRYLLGLVLAGAALLCQAPAATAQVTLGDPNSGFSVRLGQQTPYGNAYGTYPYGNAYGQPAYAGQPVPAFSQTYPPGTRYSSGYSGYTVNPSVPSYRSPAPNYN